jgi:hypothetical protein
VPWPSIRQVVLFADQEVGLRLRQGAPMPAGVRAMISDPGHPDDVPPSLRTAVPNLDRGRLEEAVRAFGGGATLTYD